MDIILKYKVNIVGSSRGIVVSVLEYYTLRLRFDSFWGINQLFDF